MSEPGIGRYNACMTAAAGDGARARFRIRQRPRVSARSRAPQLPPGLEKYLENAHAALAEPFKGVTTDGRVVPGLFPISRPGVSARTLGTLRRKGFSEDAIEATGEFADMDERA